MRIRDILQKHGSDKQCGHKYGPFYEYLLDRRRNTCDSVLEIGIDQGFSLRAWREIFGIAQIVGIDNRPECQMDGEFRITTFCVDVKDVVAMVKLASQYAPFETIIDDGSHQLVDQITALSVLRPFLSPTGVYVIEDVLPQNAEVLIKIPGASMYDGNDFTQRGDECLVCYGR